jgi:tetratricopeptide (TPR) repeat protein
MGRWHNAVALLRADQERNPDDPEIAAALGVVFAQVGELPDAAVALSFAEGSARYETRGLGTHASVLRELDQETGARALRTAEILAAQDEGAEVSAWLSAVDDELAFGDLDAALDAGFVALSIRPDSALVQAWLADIHLQRGEADEAGFWLWLSSREGQTYPRAAQVAARMALDDDAPVEALGILQPARRQRARGSAMALLQAEAYLRVGWLTDAEDLLGRARVLYGVRPDYLAIQARLHLARGEREEACQVLRQATATYPHRADARALSDEHCR